MSLCFRTLNVRGLTDDAKRRDVFNYLQQKKCDIFFIQESHSTSEKIKKWLAEWGYTAFFTSFKSNSRGVGILFKNTFEYRLHNEIIDEEGRYIILEITIHDKKMLFVNVYGPNEDDPVFFDNLKGKIDHFQNLPVIWGGDFNVVQNYLLDTLNINNKMNQKAQEKINDIKEDLDLSDPWRLKNPTESIFTWHNKRKQSRLDYFLISGTLLDNITEVKIKPGYRSDHSTVEIKLELNEQKKGPGTWKFNNSLLRDEFFVEEMRQCMKKTLDDYTEKRDLAKAIEERNYTINSQLLFEVLKMNIRGKTIAYSTYVKKQTNQHEKRLEEKMDKYFKIYSKNPTEQNATKYQEVQKELENLRQKKVEGLMFRAKAKWQCEGERSTKFFLNLENKHYTEKTIKKLVTEQGREVTKVDEIMNEQVKFYENLYKNKNKTVDLEKEQLFFPTVENNDKRLTEIDKQELENELTLRECFDTLKNMKMNTSPGADGLTVEFYKFFWKELSIPFIKSVNHAFYTEKLSDFQRLGIITCLPKPGKSKEYIKNWRPISLLNIDYKIVSGTLANRMKGPLKYLISSSQNGFIKGRTISQCTRLVYDVIYEVRKRKLDGILLLIDYEKAFDMLRWDYLEKALKYFNFGGNFRKWVKILYTDIQSSTLNNGHLSSRFNIERGVRQGDPLSPYLFILATETLTLALRRNTDIKGLEIDGTEYLDSLYADDTALLLENNRNTFEATMKLLKNFEICSGLKINLTKTTAIKLGNDKTFFEEDNGNKLQWQHQGKFRLLGIDYNLDEDDITLENYRKKATCFRNSLNIWMTRDLTIYGKIAVIKAIALPQIVHLFSAIPNPPNDIVNELQKTCFHFIWGKVDKLKRTIMYNTIENGGLKVPNLHAFCKSLKITWIKQVLNDFSFNDWKLLFYSNVEQFGGNYIWWSNEKNPAFLKHLNPFWKDVFQAWSEISNDEPNDDPRTEPLFYNSKINIGHKPVFWKDWYYSGLTHVNDIIKEHTVGEFKTWNEIKTIIGERGNFLQYIGLLKAIPKTWKDKLKAKEKLTEIQHPILHKIKKLLKPNRYAYSIIIKPNVTIAKNTQAKWAEKLETNIEPEKWKNIYTYPMKYIKETKLRALQFKIVHYILPTNVFLYKAKLKITPNCTFCQIHLETIEHLLWDCVKSKTIWLQMEDYLHSMFIHYNFTKENVLLGDANGSELIEHLKLIIKDSIYQAKIKDRELNLANILQYIKHKAKIERIYMKPQEHQRKWQNIL